MLSLLRHRVTITNPCRSISLHSHRKCATFQPAGLYLSPFSFSSRSRLCLVMSSSRYFVASFTGCGKGFWSLPPVHSLARVSYGASLYPVARTACGALTVGHSSRNLVRLQVVATQEGIEAGEDQLELCVIGKVDSRWRILGMSCGRGYGANAFGN